MSPNTDTTLSPPTGTVDGMDINELTDFANTWCRMWSETPALAYGLMTDDCRQWSGMTAALDPVVGPAAQDQFITAYREQQVNVFRARTVIADGDMFGYLWDVTHPDGTVRSGVDVNVLAGDRVRENWTFVADTHCSEPDPAPGDPISYEALTSLVAGWAAERGYTVHRRPVLDAANGRAALLRTSTATDGRAVGGVDLLSVKDATITPFWSITGTRPFIY